MNNSQTGPSSHSTPPQDKRCPIPRDSISVEQLSRRIEALEAENERIREAATEDLQNWTAKYTALMRLNTTLQNKLVEQNEEQDDHDDIRELLLIWKEVTGRNNKADIGAGSKRYGIAKAAHKRWGKQRCEHAIRGLGLQPYAGPRGRSSEEYPGSKKYNDVSHALGDEVRMESLEEVWLAYERPTLLDQGPVLKLRSLEPIREHRPGLFGGPHRRRDGLPPVDKVLNALHDHGCKVIAYPNQPDSWSAQCPAHDDRHPSLSVSRSPNGTMALWCFAGCETEDVLAVLNLTWGDLFEESERDMNRADGPPLERPMPAHLQRAMRDLLARGERTAA